MAAFTPEGWAQSLPSLAADLAQLGLSQRGALHVAHSLVNTTPRERLLQQRTAACVLLSLDFCQVCARSNGQRGNPDLTTSLSQPPTAACRAS